MKVTLTPNQIIHLHSSSGEADTRPPGHWNEERTLVASLIIGNLIFWGSLFYLLVH